MSIGEGIERQLFSSLVLCEFESKRENKFSKKQMKSSSYIYIWLSYWKSRNKGYCIKKTGENGNKGTTSCLSLSLL